MIVCALDLEMNQPSGTIIEIGYTIADTETDQIKVSKGLIVNPHEQLSDMIIKLTGINQDMVDTGQELLDAYLEMVKDCEDFSAHRQPVVWGSGDLRVLREQVYKKDANVFANEWSFGYTEMNIKGIVQGIMVANGRSAQGGLAKSLLKFGLNFKGTKHRAIDDSANTFFLYVELLKRLKCLTL